MGRAAERYGSGGGRRRAQGIRDLTIILTRPEGLNERLSKRLRPFGYRVVEAPLIQLELIESAPIDVSSYDWVVLTSVTGARELRRRASGRPRHVAAIGSATAEAWGAKVDLVPAVSTQEGLIAEFPQSPGRVLFAGSENARRLLIDELQADFVALYRTRAVRPEQPLHGDLVVLASASAARAYAELALGIPAVTIGPETTSAAEEGGVRVLRQAATHDVDGLVAAVLDVSR